MGAEAADHKGRCPRWVRLGLAIVWAVYLGYSSFGIAAPFLWGHHGYHGATYMQRARTSLAFGLVTPANWSGYVVPPPKLSYYLHHPIGYHHVLTLAIPVLGDREWVARGIAAAGGLLVLLALFRLVRAFWSCEAALFASAAYVALPILCSFSVLSDPMLPAMACSIVTVHVYLRYLQTPSRRWLLLACAAYVAGGLLMWEAFFQAFFHGVHALLWMLSRRGSTHRRAALKWFFATGLCSALTLGFHFLYTWKVGMLDEFFVSFQQRHTTTFDHAYARHKMWLEINYGWPIIYLGVAWVALFFVRTALGRARARDQAVWIFFLINSLYIYLFAQGSSIHLYRVFWYSSFLVLATTDLIASLHGAVGWLLGRWPEAAARASAAVAAIAAAAHLGINLPHAYRNLLESRVMMGTHGQPGYDAQYQKMLFAKEVRRRMPRDGFFIAHANLQRRLEFQYYLDLSHEVIPSLAQLPGLRERYPRAALVLDINLPPWERRIALDLLRRHPGYLYDHYLMIDLGSDRQEFREYRFVPMKPSWTWRWFVSHRYPPMRPVEVHTSFGSCVYARARRAPPADLPPPPPPPRLPAGDVLCRHNFEVASGRPDAASEYRGRLFTPEEVRDAPLPGMGRLVAVRPVGGRRVEVWTLIREVPNETLRYRFRLEPQGDGKNGPGPITGEKVPDAEWPPWEMTRDYLHMETFLLSAPPGPYRLRLSAARDPRAPPTDLGVIELR